MYNLTTDGKNWITNQLEVEYTFDQAKTCSVTLIAENLVSRQILEVEIKVIDKLMGLNFHAGKFNASTSVLGSEAAFHFYLKTGMGYTCEINYGDGSTDIYNDDVIKI